MEPFGPHRLRLPHLPARRLTTPVQTFLPYPDFAESAAALDPRRLGKQRVEVLQILKALATPGYGWRNHPAVLMWAGHDEALARYGLEVCRAWCALGFEDTCAAKILDDLRRAGAGHPRSQAELAAAGALPGWLGDEALHRSHRSALVRKDPERYRARFPDEPDDLPYLWPVRSPSAVEAERRREAAGRAREERAAKKAGLEAERAARKRSLAAKKAWKTRRANAKPAAPAAAPPGADGA